MAKLVFAQPNLSNIWTNSGVFGKTRFGHNIPFNFAYPQGSAGFSNPNAFLSSSTFGSTQGLTYRDTTYGDTIKTLFVGSSFEIFADRIYGNYSEIATRKNDSALSTLTGINIDQAYWNIILENWDTNRSFDLYSSLMSGGDHLLGSDNGYDHLGGYNGPDNMSGFGGDDFLHGMFGQDYINGGSGSDTIRGGHGHDYLIGDSGSDYIWGGTGFNIVSLGEDNDVDQVIVPADRVKNSNGNPNGVNADIITDLRPNDKIFIHGVEDSSLTFAEGVLHPKNGQFTMPEVPGLGERNFLGSYSGVGIFSDGTLEAIVNDVGLTAQAVNDQTSGGFY